MHFIGNCSCSLTEEKRLTCLSGIMAGWLLNLDHGTVCENHSWLPSSCSAVLWNSRGKERPPVANTCSYNSRAVCPSKLVVKNNDPTSRNMSLVVLSISTLIILHHRYIHSRSFLPADSLSPTCQAHALRLTRKHLTNKLWFMAPLKGVIWGLWWKLQAGTKNWMSLSCQVVQGPVRAVIARTSPPNVQEDWALSF